MLQYRIDDRADLFARIDHNAAVAAKAKAKLGQCIGTLNNAANAFDKLGAPDLAAMCREQAVASVDASWEPTR